MRALGGVNVPFLAGMFTVIAFAAWGLRAACSPSGRARTSVVAACAALLVQTAIFARFTTDDAFITFRYSRNWARGLGPVFQPGERVEGYTSFLHMGLLALAHRFGIDIEIASKVVGILSSLAAVVGVSVLVGRLGGGDRAAKLAPILLSLIPLNAAWRWHYFGAFFPNTFYAKTSLSLGRAVGGVVSVSNFFAEIGLVHLLLFVLGASTLPTGGVGFRFVLAAVASFLAYAVVVGGDLLALRFYVHILPLWTACVAIGLDRALRAVDGSSPGRSPARAWAVALAIAVPWVFCAYKEYGSAFEPEPHNNSGASTTVDVSTHIRTAHEPLGEWLRLHAPRQCRVAITDIGIIAYRCDLPTIDLWGLTDRRIARLIHAKADAHAYAADLRARKPELFVLYGSSKGATLGVLEDNRQWFNEFYRPHSFWPDSRFDKGLVLLVRKDVEVPPVSPPGLALHSIARPPGAASIF